MASSGHLCLNLGVATLFQAKQDPKTRAADEKRHIEEVTSVLAALPEMEGLHTITLSIYEREGDYLHQCFTDVFALKKHGWYKRLRAMRGIYGLEIEFVTPQGGRVPFRHPKAWTRWDMVQQQRRRLLRDGIVNYLALKAEVVKFTTAPALQEAWLARQIHSRVIRLDGSAFADDFDMDVLRQLNDGPVKGLGAEVIGLLLCPRSKGLDTGKVEVLPKDCVHDIVQTSLERMAKGVDDCVQDKIRGETSIDEVMEYGSQGRVLAISAAEREGTTACARSAVSMRQQQGTIEDLVRGPTSIDQVLEYEMGEGMLAITATEDGELAQAMSIAIAVHSTSSIDDKPYGEVQAMVDQCKLMSSRTTALLKWIATSEMASTMTAGLEVTQQQQTRKALILAGSSSRCPDQLLATEDLLTEYGPVSPLAGVTHDDIRGRALLCEDPFREGRDIGARVDTPSPSVKISGFLSPPADDQTPIILRWLKVVVRSLFLGPPVSHAE